MSAEGNAVINIEDLESQSDISIKLATIFPAVAHAYNTRYNLQPLGVPENQKTMTHPLAALEKEQDLVRLFQKGRVDVEAGDPTVISERYKTARKIVNDELAERNIFSLMLK